jgi:hypothetical protein
MEGWSDSVLLNETSTFGTYPIFSVNKSERTDSADFRFFFFFQSRGLLELETGASESSWMYSSVQQDAPGTARTTHDTCRIHPQLIYISRFQCTTRDEESWRSWTWPMKNHVSQGLGGNGRNSYKQELRNSHRIKSIGQSRLHGTSANQTSKAYQKDLYLDMAI